MKTIISALAVVAALGLAAAPAMAQQTVTQDGTPVDGLGSGNNTANRFVFDGPANADVTSLTTAVGGMYSGNRVNRLDCDIHAIIFHCSATASHHSADTYLR